MPEKYQKIIRTQLSFSGQDLYLIRQGLTSIASNRKHDSRLWPLIDKITKAEERISTKYQEIGQASSLARASGGEE